jgi:GT2 family glycosyltransferase
MGTTPATVVVVTHDSADHIGPTLAALAADDRGPAEIVVVDNASSDGTVALARDAGVRVVERATNDGFAAACHDGVRAASEESVVLLNPDAVPVPGWLPPLVAALDVPGVGAAMATLELEDRPGHFNSSGGAITASGMAWATDVGDPVPDDEAPTVDVPFASGAAMAIRRSTWERVGGMRPEFFLYHEDTDLGWRLSMAGLRSVRVSASRVRHRYDFGRNPGKLGMIERNRLLMTRSVYRASTRLLLAPVLMGTGLGTFTVALRDGWWREWLTARREAWGMRRGNAEWRRRIATTRLVGDAAILRTRANGFGSMSQVKPPRGASAVTALFSGWIRLVVPLVGLLDRRAGLE